MAPSDPRVTGYVTVTEAANRLDLTPYDVMRLIKSGEVDGLVLVKTTSLDAIKEKS